MSHDDTMTDNPVDHMTRPGNEADATVATAVRGARRAGVLRDDHRRAARPARTGTDKADSPAVPANAGAPGVARDGDAARVSEPGGNAGTHGVRVVGRGARVLDRPVHAPGERSARDRSVIAPPLLPQRAVPGRVHVTWRHALLAGLACFAVWLLLDAPTLLRSAQAGPLGARRTFAVALLRPVARASDAMGLSHVVGSADKVIGHTGYTGSGVLQVEGPSPHQHRTAPGRVHGGPLPAHPPSPTTPVTAPDGLAPLAAPTAAAPLRVLVVGDSLGIDVGQPLVNDLAATGVVRAVLDGHIDTGLARPDYFDWSTELQGDLGRYQPQAVVVFIGANDPQNFIEGGTAVAYGGAAWSSAYAKRVASFMQTATDAGARVLWVGMPPMADPVLNAKMQVLNAIYQDQAATHPGVTYFSSWPVLSDPEGRFATFLPDASGNEVQVREPDGTHIAAPGAQRLSLAAMAEMDRVWGINP